MKSLQEAQVLDSFWSGELSLLLQGIIPNPPAPDKRIYFIFEKWTQS